MASAGNVSLGAVVSITDATQSSPIYYGFGGLKGPPRSRTSRHRSSPGTQDLSATVTVVFEIS